MDVLHEDGYVTTEDSTKSTYPARWFSGDPIDCVVLALPDLFFAAWTMLIRGQREVVAFQVRPRWVKLSAPEVESAWIAPATAELTKHLPAQPRALTASQMRSLPWRDVLRARQEAAFPPSDGWIYAPEVAEHLGLSDRELEYLVDAWTFVEAVESGHRAPAQVIADDRQISPRTAQGRIAKAEALGFLTPVGRGHRNRRMTPRASALIDQILGRYGTEGGSGG